MSAPQAAGRFKEVEEEDITRLRGMTLFGIIKQMQHLCGVASMIVSPEGALSTSGFALGWQNSLGGYNLASNPTEMLNLFNVSDNRQYSGDMRQKVENEIDVASILTL